ncbi:MAG: SIMPL domain-containing protein [Campylobacteraceae bacterium]|nr:SIMPL domain-containing protein [Campylobacteraceae bacterium]
MKFLALLILPIYLFSFEVNFNKKFSKSLTEDTLTTYFSVVVEGDSEKEINKTLKKFNKKIKTYNKIEKSSGTLTVRPQYRTSNNAPKITGYRGELRYQVSSNKASYLNEFVSKMIELKEERSTNIVISNLRWTVKDSTFDIANDILRLEAINWGTRYAKNLSKDLRLKCEVKNISINSSNYRPMARMMYSNAEMTDAKIAVPESNKEDISINPSFLMECK